MRSGWKLSLVLFVVFLVTAASAFYGYTSELARISAVAKLEK